MAEEKKYDALIKLWESKYARCFKGRERIHQAEYERVKQLLDQRIQGIPSSKSENNDIFLEHRYDTISIFGGRGAGKTSFLYSLLKDYQENRNDLTVLPIIDPTMIEEKGHVFLMVVSLVNDAVTAHLTNNEMRPGTAAYTQRRNWEICLKELAYGIPALEDVGKGYATDKWEDQYFIMEEGLKSVSAAFRLERNFQQLIDQALSILKKKAFVLAFDDIDVQMKKGWDVLEILRKYLTSPKMICLLSGNMRLYGNNVRCHQWQQFDELLRYEDKTKFLPQVDELENQYLLKILKAENRVHLHTLREMKNLGCTPMVQTAENAAPVSIDTLYKERLRKLGIEEEEESTACVNFLLSLPVRSQLQFLEGTERSAILAFSSAMYAGNIAIDTASQSPEMISPVILRYLFANDLLGKNYLLLPSREDISQNSCLMGLGILLTRHANTYPFVLFDYMLRVGYVREMCAYSRVDARTFIDENGFLLTTSFKDIIGRSIAYLESTLVNGAEVAGHARLYAVGTNNSISALERVDASLKDAEPLHRMICEIPMVSLAFSSKNESRLYYSVYVLLAAIAELLQAADVKRTLKEIVARPTYMATRQPSRAFPSRGRENVGEENAEEEKEFQFLEDESQWDNLAHAITQWREDYQNISAPKPPYFFGKIIGRFTSAVKTIRRDDLGDQMEKTIVCFLNACLVEEMTGQAGINPSNSVNDTMVFEGNLSKMKDCAKIPFTLWMMSCPLLNCFVGADVFAKLADETAKAKISGDSFKPFNVKAVLKAISIKDTPITVGAQPSAAQKREFSGAKEKIKGTVEHLKANNIDIKKCLLDVSPEEAKEWVNKSGLFEKTRKNSTHAFQQNFKVIYGQ